MPVVGVVVEVLVVAVLVAVPSLAVLAESANLFAFLSFVVVCIFRFEALLYDLSFTYTSVDGSGAGVSSVAAEAAVVVFTGGAFFRSFAFWYSLRIST